MYLYKGIIGDIIYTVATEEVGKGKYLKLFEEEFAKYIGTKYAVTICSKREGLRAVLDSLNLKEDSQIVVPAYGPNGLIEKVITPQSKAILVTHLFGLSCDIEKVLHIAERYDLKIIEDCTQAVGTEFKNRKLGSFGNAGLFNLEVNDPINAFGGCMITTDDPGLAQAIRNRVKVLNSNSPKFPSSLRILKKIFMNLTEESFGGFLVTLLRFKCVGWFLNRPYQYIYKNARIECPRFTNLQALIGLKQLRLLGIRNNQRLGSPTIKTLLPAGKN